MFAAFELGAVVFARGGPGFADNVIAWRRRLAIEDLYTTYTIIPPQDDRSRIGREHDEPKQVRVAAERDGGIVLRGAQMLGTGAAVADIVFVACLHPLRQGDEDFAVSCCVPCGMPGSRHKVDPDRWRPLLMSFHELYSLSDRAAPSRLSDIPEERWRPQAPAPARLRSPPLCVSPIRGRRPTGR